MRVSLTQDEREIVKEAIKDADAFRALILRYQSGEPVEHLVLEVSRRGIKREIEKHRAYFRDWKDLWQEGRLAALDAARRFDPSKGRSPFGWICDNVKWELRRWLINYGDVVRVPNHHYDRTGFGSRLRLVPVSRFFWQAHKEDQGRYDEQERIVDEDAVEVYEDLSYDEVVRLMPDVAWHLLRTLDVRSREMVHRRAMALEEEVLQEIADSYDLSHERVRQIVEQSLHVMRDRASELISPPRVFPKRKAADFYEWVSLLARAIDERAGGYSFVLPRYADYKVVGSPYQLVHSRSRCAHPVRVRADQKEKKKMKFEPTKSRFPKNFAGFWKPKTGDVLKGHIIDEFDGEYGKSLLVTLTAPLIVEQLDRQTSEKSDYEAKAGEVVGVNVKAGLRGLDKYVGHTATIKYLGMVAEGRTTQHQFDVDVSDKKVEITTKEVKAPAASKSARA